MSLSAILTEAYNFFRNHIVQLAMLTVPLLLLQVGIQMWLGAELLNADPENPQFGTPHMLAVIALMVIFSVLIAALTLFMELRTEGMQPSTGQVLKSSLAFVPGLMLAGVFSGMAIAAPTMILAAIGPIWILGMGISLYLFARLAFVNFMVVVERMSPLQAIKASFEFSSGLTGTTILVLLSYFPLLLIGSVLSQLGQAGGMPLQLVMDTFVAFIGLFVNVALFRLYRVARKGRA